jgi:hypothetical protein
MSEHGSSNRSASNGKRQRKSITLEEQSYVIRTQKRNKYMADIANAMGIPQFALRTIMKL